MIDIPPALQAKLDQGATTLCWVWILTRRDGAKFGLYGERVLSDKGIANESRDGDSNSGLTHRGRAIVQAFVKGVWGPAISFQRGRFI